MVHTIWCATRRSLAVPERSNNNNKSNVRKSTGDWGNAGKLARRSEQSVDAAKKQVELSCVCVSVLNTSDWQQELPGQLESVKMNELGQ